MCNYAQVNEFSNSVSFQIVQGQMAGFIYLLGFLLITIIINVKLVVDREIFSVLCSIFRSNSWDLDIGNTRVSVQHLKLPLFPCIFACNKVSYKNSASLISGRASTSDVIRKLTDFQKNDNIVNRKKQQHKSITVSTGNGKLQLLTQKDLYKVRVN